MQRADRPDLAHFGLGKPRAEVGKSRGLGRLVGRLDNAKRAIPVLRTIVFVTVLLGCVYFESLR